MLIKTEHGTKPRYLSTDALKDYAGNLFVSAIYYDDENHYDGRMRLFKVTPDAAVSLVGERLMSRAKGDAVGICQSGADIIVVMSGHIGDPDTDLELVEAFVGVAVAYPGGVQPGHGGAQAYTEGQSTGGSGLTDEDKAWLQGRYDDLFNRVVAAFGGDIRRGIHDKAKQAVQEAITEAHVVTEGMFNGGSGSAIVYNQLRNTSYSGALDALHAPKDAPQEGK